mmetsp:Transcript_1966/g.7100  ORF Transcript_1966/g.7100 Transcript_1966/m.7100 type:complete len:256 (+) Transcript_1966:762-1529(+)
MPDVGGEGVVEHPVDHARAHVLVPRVGLVHRTVGFIARCLRLECILLRAVALSVARVEGRSEVSQRAKEAVLVAAVVVPPEVDRPFLVAGNRPLDRVVGHGRGTRPSLREESKRTTEGRAAGVHDINSVLEPVVRRLPHIGAAHLHAGGASEGRGEVGSGGECRVGPVLCIERVEVHLLHVGRRQLVAAVEEHQHARVDAQPLHLRTDGFGRHEVVLRRPVLPVLPRVAAAPAGHHEDAVAVGETVELVVLHLAL